MSEQEKLTMYDIDPMGEALFGDESVEFEERMGLAIIEAAKHNPIRYTRNVLPDARMSTGDGSHVNLAFHGHWISYNEDELTEKYPELKEQIHRRCVQAKALDEAWHFDPAQNKYRKMASKGVGWAGTWGGHANPDFGRIVNIGTDGVRRLIAECAAKHPESDWFYRACGYSMDALDILGERFRALAIEEAAKESDPVRRAHLEDAAKAFEVIPKKPAYDFVSAVACFWLVFSFDGIDSPGRFDQYMFRAYALSDDKEATADALDRLWEEFHDTRTWNLCLSGSDENWNDMTNQLTFDILRLAAKKKFQTPNITLRVHRNTPKKLWDEIANTLASGIGMPALYNDETVCAALEEVGIPPRDSHLYCMNGCNQIDIMGKSHMGLEDGVVIFSRVLEYALHDGMSYFTDEEEHDQESIHTGNAREFTSYEQLEAAFMKQLEYVTTLTCMSANSYQHRRAAYEVNPYRSCLIEGCLESGFDYRNGGPLYGHGQIRCEAMSDVGDSLWAVKKLVFTEKKYTMDQLITALEKNWEGYEDMRLDFSRCEKFGNDIEEVDEITAKIVNRFFTILKRQRTYRGGVYMGGCSPFNGSAANARATAALPNGRFEREQLIADAIGAVPGCDVCGPTALINSALKYHHLDSGSGFILQVKYDKAIFNTPKGKESFIQMAKTFFEGGGQQYTVSVVSQEELLEAQKDPENHRDLIVRVGGYSDYFVNLEPGLQENIIKRTVL